MSGTAPASGADAAAAVELRDASFAYPDGTLALRSIDLRLGAGEFVTLLGPSGCGKSSLLKIVAGLLAPTHGSLRQAGADAQRPDISFVFQAPTLLPWASVEANVRLPLDLAGVPRAQAAPRVAQALALVGLSGRAAALPHTLSGGMQMRVSIARALVTRPRLLLLDEPFGALDEITRQRLDAELLELWRSQGFSVLFVTHAIHEAVFLSQRVLVMAARPGRIVREVVIDEPYPRGSDFPVSPRFLPWARRLQEALAQASALDPAADAA
jgi:NitT/TauT family transport system ATP-binding protein